MWDDQISSTGRRSGCFPPSAGTGASLCILR